MVTRGSSSRNFVKKRFPRPNIPIQNKTPIGARQNWNHDPAQPKSIRLPMLSAKRVWQRLVKYANPEKGDVSANVKSTLHQVVTLYGKILSLEIAPRYCYKAVASLRKFKELAPLDHSRHDAGLPKHAKKIPLGRMQILYGRRKLQRKTLSDTFRIEYCESAESSRQGPFLLS